MNEHGRHQEPGRQLLHGRPADREHRQPERGQPGRAVLQLERRRAADPAAVDEPDVGRLVAPARRRRRCSTSTTCTSDGKDLGVRWPLNTRINGGARRYADLPLNPANPTMNMSIGQSTYDGVNFGVRRRMNHGIQLNAWYSLSKADGPRRPGGRRADDEPRAGFDATRSSTCRLGPAARTDARHKVTLSAIIQAPWGITVVADLPLPLGDCRCTSGTATTTTRTASATTSTRRPTGSPASTTPACRRSRRWARARRSTAAAARRCRSSTSAWRRAIRIRGTA